MIASAKEIAALNITLFNSRINFANIHLCNYCTKIFVILINTCVYRRSVDNKALIYLCIYLSIGKMSACMGENKKKMLQIPTGIELTFNRLRSGLIIVQNSIIKELIL